jgi:hypothetical protein
MSRDITVIPFRQPDAVDDPLSEVAREGARRMLAQLLIAEADAFVAQWKDLKLPDDRVVRHGHGPQRARLIDLVTQSPGSCYECATTRTTRITRLESVLLIGCIY